MRKLSLFLILVAFSVYVHAQDAKNTNDKMTFKSSNGTIAMDVVFNLDNTCFVIFRTGLPGKKDLIQNEAPEYRYTAYTEGSDHSSTNYGTADGSIHGKTSDKIKNCNKNNFITLVCEAISSYKPDKYDMPNRVSGIAVGASRYTGYMNAIEEDKAECNANNLVERILKIKKII